MLGNSYTSCFFGYTLSLVVDLECIFPVINSLERRTNQMEGSTAIGLKDCLSGVNFSAVFAEIKDCVPLVLPAIIALAGFRKGISFVMGMIHGA